MPPSFTKTTNAMTDSELVCMFTANRTRDLAAQKLYGRYSAAIESWCLRYTNVLPSDVLAEIPHLTLLTAFEVIEAGGYEQRGVFSNWLFGIFRNKIHEAYREHKTRNARRAEPLPVERGGGDPLDQFPIPTHRGDQLLEINEINEILSKLVRSFKISDQYLIQMRLIQHAEYSLIADNLGITEVAARKRMERCKKKLTKYLDAYGVNSSVVVEIDG